jgi:hypothetical protein
VEFIDIDGSDRPHRDQQIEALRLLAENAELRQQQRRKTPIARTVSRPRQPVK